MYFQVILHLNKSSLAASISCNLTKRDEAFVAVYVTSPNPGVSTQPSESFFVCVCLIMLFQMLDIRVRVGSALWNVLLQGQSTVTTLKMSETARGFLALHHSPL